MPSAQIRPFDLLGFSAKLVVASSGRLHKASLHAFRTNGLFSNLAASRGDRRQRGTDMKSCFVISPIGLPGSEVREHADDVFDFIIKPAAEKAGYVPIRADHEARPGTITEQMYDRILGDDLLIAILTGHNPNVFYEVAIAEAAARPLILLIESGSAIPFDISGRRVLQYDLKPRTLQNGVYVDSLFRSITELETVDEKAKVPFRPSLKPLGDGESLWRLVPRSRDVPREDAIGLVTSARSFVWYQGLALFSFAKLSGFEKAVQTALARGVEIRVLLMDPDNEVLPHMMREFTSNYLENIRSEIRSGVEFWAKFSASGPVTLRYQRKGAMFGLLQQSDSRAMYTQYSLARATSESATIIAPAATPFYDAMKEDYEWQWDRAETA
jgi:hypothetical protein